MLTKLGINFRKNFCMKRERERESLIAITYSREPFKVKAIVFWLRVL